MKRPSTRSLFTWLFVAALAAFAVYHPLDVEDGMIRSRTNHPNSKPTPTS